LIRSTKRSSLDDHYADHIEHYFRKSRSRDVDNLPVSAGALRSQPRGQAASGRTPLEIVERAIKLCDG